MSIPDSGLNEDVTALGRFLYEENSQQCEICRGTHGQQPRLTAAGRTCMLMHAGPSIHWPFSAAIPVLLNAFVT